MVIANKSLSDRFDAFALRAGPRAWMDRLAFTVIVLSLVGIGALIAQKGPLIVIALPVVLICLAVYWFTDLKQRGPNKKDAEFRRLNR